MRKLLLLASLAAVPVLVGCSSASSYVHSDTALGRVVVYRNGIAYFERSARVESDTLSLSVPADKVDDFLKSLTVVDAKTGEPAPIAYPTQAPPSAGTGLIDMKIHLQGAAPHDIKLSYVTEAPSWKPSYRIVVGTGGKVKVEGWAVVDNTSGEDWQNVQLGVGSSSALSFRFDLRSVRLVQRETLRSDDLFAQAPPMGGATYAQMQQGGPQQKVMVELTDDALAANLRREAEVQEMAKAEKKASRSYQQNAPAPIPQPTVVHGRAAGGKAPIGRNLDIQQYKAAEVPAQPAPPVNQLEAMARSLKGSNKQIVVEGFADKNDGDKHAASLDRANRAREQLIRGGIDPNRVVAVGQGEQPGRAAGVRIVEAGNAGGEGKKDHDGKAEGQAPPGTDPIGTSHFESKSRMSVARGTSAMVSILKTETEGEVVYLYDPESQRGNTQFPFRAVRIKNPTDSALESGPVTVFGEGKFIGEGMSEPIPARGAAFIPFALDRQIAVERKEAGEDRIARIITAQRGVFSTEMQHTKRTVLAFHNRSGERAAVYVRHTVEKGYKLVTPARSIERLGSAHVFRVDVEPNGKGEIVIEEATPVFRTTDIRSPAGMEMVTAYLSSAALEGPLKNAVNELLKLQRDMANVEQQIGTTRDQMAEYRARMDELHAQIVTLKAVKTAGPLMQSLEKKLQEVSDKLSKATIDLVGLQEKLMVARIKFQDGVSEISLEKKEEKRPAAPAPPPS